MPFVSLSRIAAYIVASIAAAMLLATQIVAQSSGTVDCGNGFYCPKDNACLVGGLCGRLVDAVPGAVRTSTGTWCDPGFRESKFKPGGCVPGSYTECSATVMCAPGDTCGTDGDCHAGATPKGPTCGKLRCHEGRICASTGRCMNTRVLPGLRQWHDLLQTCRLRASERLRPGRPEEDEADQAHPLAAMLRFSIPS